jgi:hypothetical protein
MTDNTAQSSSSSESVVLEEEVCDSLGRLGRYSGPLDEEHYPHGANGVMLYVNDKDVVKYSGDWVHGHWERGDVSYVRGDVYKGSFNKLFKQHGHGTYSWSNGSYEGEWKSGLYDGVGKHQSVDEKGRKHSYHGKFVAGKPATPPVPQATVSKTTPTSVVENQMWTDPGTGDLVVYRGLWRDGHPVGNGTLLYVQREGQAMPDRISYDGLFDDSNGLYHGQGRLVWRNGDAYEGNFVHGTRDGAGVYRWKDGRQYQGQFEKNVRHGRGVFIYPNNDMYEGHFVLGKREGKGRFVFSDGSEYDGEWKDGSYSDGKLVQKSGITYIGQFLSGQRHGKSNAEPNHV